MTGKEALSDFLRSMDVASVVVAVGAALLGGFANSFAQWLVRKSRALRAAVADGPLLPERSLATELAETRR
jgi:hypothetical protein